MANIFNINDKNILATASITITDQTDAAKLGGGISVVSGSKNQVYLTGTDAYSPDWSRQNLVLRPYLYASSIVRGQGTDYEYNPDLFDPAEYPNLYKPQDNNVSTAYVNPENLQWFVRDASGAETLIDYSTSNDDNFSFIYSNGNTVYDDKRFLVIRRNFLKKDSFATIICRFSFFDPFAKIFIKQTYELDLSCLSTGMGTNRLVIHSINGTSIYNSHPNYIDLYCSFYQNGVKVDIQDELENPSKSSALRWYIRSAGGEGWILLDGTKQDNEEYDYTSMFEVHRYSSHDDLLDVYATERTNSARGGFLLRIHPALITGSNVIKAVFTPSDEGVNYNALEVVYDTTDDVQAFIHSSNGDKIYEGIQSVGTTLTCMIKYQGELMASTDTRYDNFEYYWFKVSSDGTQTWNVWINNMGEFKANLLTEGFDTLKSSSRIMQILPKDVDHVNMFQCAIVDKVQVANEQMRELILTNSPSEEDIMTAALLVSQLNLDDDINEILNTAYEINASNIENGNSFTK